MTHLFKKVSLAHQLFNKVRRNSNQIKKYTLVAYAAGCMIASIAGVQGVKASWKTIIIDRKKVSICNNRKK